MLLIHLNTFFLKKLPLNYTVSKTKMILKDLTYARRTASRDDVLQSVLHLACNNEVLKPYVYEELWEKLFNWFLFFTFKGKLFCFKWDGALFFFSLESRTTEAIKLIDVVADRSAPLCTLILILLGRSLLLTPLESDRLP